MRFIAASLALASSFAYADVPPPPLPPQVAASATMIAQALEANDVTAYERLLASKLNVWINGQKVASDRSSWLSNFRPKLMTNGVRFKVERILAGDKNFVLLTHYDSRGSFQQGRQECCELYEISKYELKEGQVYRIDISTTGNHDITRVASSR